MAIAWNSVFTTFGDETDTTLTVSYAPATTIQGIFVIVFTPTHGTDRITGVTFGGDALASVVVASDNVDEPGSAHFFFLGASIPAGTNDVVITVTGGITQLRGVIGSVTAAGDTEIIDFDSIGANQTNPQLTLATGSDNAAVAAGVYSGLSDVASLTAVSGQTQIQSDDFGSHVTISTRRTAIESGNITIGWTAGTDDVAMVAAAIIESPTVGPLAFFDVTDMPEDFGTMDTVELVARWRGQGFGTGTINLYAQIFEADETTPLTDEELVATATTNTSFADTSPIVFSTVEPADKTTWDGARLRLRWASS